jgi:hypothetical protein
MVGFSCSRLGLLRRKPWCRRLRASISPLGAPLGSCYNRCMRGFWVKTLFGCGRASAAPLASHPPWGRRLLRPDLTCGGRCVAFGGEGGLGVACWVVVARPWLCRKKKEKRKNSSFSFEWGRREGVFLGCVWWFVSTAGQSCGDPDRCPFPDRSFTVVWVDRVDVPIRPMSCKVERCVVRSQSNPPESLVCVVCGAHCPANGCAMMWLR